MKRLLFTALVLVFTLAAVCASHALSDKGIDSPAVIQSLGLTDVQQAGITSGEQDLEKELAPLKQSIQRLRSDINRELSSDSPDKAKIDRALDEVSVKMAEIQKKKIAYMLWIRGQLTPEQRQKLTSFLQKTNE